MVLHYECRGDGLLSPIEVVTASPVLHIAARPALELALSVVLGQACV